MIATIDDISDGRCGLNIVTGWNRPEYAQMGMWPEMLTISVAMIMQLSMCRYFKPYGNPVGQVGMGNISPR
ncbi:MAG: hypothetical protein CM15mP92_2470 [Halieaceae bacterium]|nr:MAG: hypothetical protein CM15mP92_2470 [Halieaceae bacterium]